MYFVQSQVTHIIILCLYKYRIIQTIGIGYYTRCVSVRPSERGKPSIHFWNSLHHVLSLFLALVFEFSVSTVLGREHNIYENTLFWLDDKCLNSACLILTNKWLYPTKETTPVSNDFPRPLYMWNRFSRDPYTCGIDFPALFTYIFGNIYLR